MPLLPLYRLYQYLTPLDADSLITSTPFFVVSEGNSALGVGVTPIPDILVETGFLTNSFDVSLLSTRPEEFAAAIAAPIIPRLGISPDNGNIRIVL
ncbi:hypothetical protein RSX31_09160 [Rossellomorea sp. YC4-1]|nr:hypothetical protein [Rossellomorea sp. YC4-1]